MNPLLSFQGGNLAVCCCNGIFLPKLRLGRGIMNRARDISDSHSESLAFIRREVNCTHMSLF